MEEEDVEALVRAHTPVTIMSAMVCYLIKFLARNINDGLIKLLRVLSNIE